VSLLLEVGGIFSDAEVHEVEEASLGVRLVLLVLLVSDPASSSAEGAPVGRSAPGSLNSLVAESCIPRTAAG
jgi:hypothetical protein